MTDIKVQEAFVTHFTDGRLALELCQIANEPRGHTLQYRGVVMKEAATRLEAMHLILGEVKAALQQYEQDLTDRKHGGVAAGHLIDKLRPLLKDTSTRPGE